MEQEYFKEQCKKVLDIIQDSDNIILAGHRSPDGDSLGSVLAFANGLYQNEQKRAIPYSIDSVPDMFHFLYNSASVVNTVGGKVDCLIGFDYGDFERLGIDENTLSDDVKIISFDHHPQRNQKGDICIINTECASTTELLYYFMKEVGWSIDKHTAECLLTGIITDTGNFAYNTRHTTFNVAGILSSLGASVSSINKKIKEAVSQEVLNIHGQLIEMAEMDEEHNCIRLFLSFEEFNSLGISLSDLSGVVGNLNRVDSVDFSVFVVEYEPEVVKGSLRGEETKGIPVSPIAEYLGGGGHKYAAGFLLNMPYEEARYKIEQAIKQNMGIV